MSMWDWLHWIVRGCTPEEVRPGCGTCGYPPAADAVGGICPECGVPYIPATLQLRGPTPPVHWLVGWLVGPSLFAIFCGWMVVSLQTPLIIAIAGLLLLVAARLQQESLDWLVHRTVGDLNESAIDGHGVGAWCIMAVLTVSSTINGLIGVVLLPLGVVLLFMN